MVLSFSKLLNIGVVATLLLASFGAAAWVPSGAQDLTLKKECRPEVLTSIVIERFGRRSNSATFDSRDWKDFEKILQGYFDECETELQHSSLSKVFDYAQMNLVTYDMRNHPRMKQVEFKIPGRGVTVRGVLAIQNSTQPRPLIIYQCGLTCDLYDASMLATMMIFYDMGPFNVLALQSNSGGEFVKANNVFAVGGMEEGHQLLEIARYIKSGNWEYSKYVTQIHLFGMSLGGQAAMYAGLYADHDRLQEGASRLVKSVFVGCPVVDFKPSFERVTSNSLLSKLIRNTLFKNIVEAMAAVPFFGRYFDTSSSKKFKPSQELLQEMLSAGAVDYYKQRTRESEWGTPPLEDVRFRTAADVWGWMNFSKRPVELLETPLFVWAPRNDNVVEYPTNTGKLLQSDARNPEPKIYTLDTPRGGHCAMAAVYGWQTSAAMMNAFYLAQSPEMLSKLRVYDLRFPIKPKMRAAGGARKRTHVAWVARENKPKITLRMQIQHMPCGFERGVAKSCSGFEEVDFTYAELGLSNAHIPKSKIEAQGVSRWLNASLRFLDVNKQPLGQSQNPAYLRWTRYDGR